MDGGSVERMLSDLTSGLYIIYIDANLLCTCICISKMFKYIYKVCCKRREKRVTSEVIKGLAGRERPSKLQKFSENIFFVLCFGASLIKFFSSFDMNF